MSFNKTLLSSTLVFLFLASLASAASVTRSVSPSSVPYGETMTVSLTVDVSGSAGYYAIDEMYPSGWSVIDAGSGSIEHAGHWKEVVIEGAKNTVYTYTLRAPSQDGIYTFSGEYMFGGMEDTAPISGTETIECKANACTVYGTSQSIDPILVGGIVVILILAGLVFMNRDKLIKK
jgi:hypothetical protein